MNSENSRCIIIGASHAGVTAAFALRQHGWKGEILLFDRQPSFPHQKPPLSKGFLSGKFQEKMMLLKAEQAYQKADIQLHTGTEILGIDRKSKKVEIEGQKISYDKIILASGSEAKLPPINGLTGAKNCFTIRHMTDTEALKICLEGLPQSHRKVVIVGAGYIGLEVAASLKGFGAEVTILEKESRILSRVTGTHIADFLSKMHEENGIKLALNASVEKIGFEENQQFVYCDDGTKHPSDILIVGVGVRVNQELAEHAGLAASNGVHVNGKCQTNDEDIYAVGDCTYHYSEIYGRNVRLESVQNAMDQANVAAMNIVGKDASYNKVPWFWSDQFGIKLQIVGLLDGYSEFIVKDDPDKENSVSVWYFRENKLLAIDAINQPKSYMIGMRAIPQKLELDLEQLKNATQPIKIENIT
ncbi:MAG: FAD/NAD(P)-binding oxidoreductase, partial [Bacteroidota bacterium]